MDVYWFEQSESDVPPHDAWLAGREAACLAAMRFVKRRTDWRLGRWTAKQAVAAYLRLESAPGVLSRLEIRAATTGAPQVFCDGEPAPVAISLSHRSGTAACAVAMPGAHLGCDLEAIEPRTEAFIADYFTVEERDVIAHASTAGRAELVALLWSAKESALKALGEGLRLDTRSVVVTLLDRATSPGVGGWQPLEVCTREGRIFHGWWQCTDILVRTLVTAHPTSPPTPLTSKFISAPVDTAEIEPFSRHDLERSEGESARTRWRDPCHCTGKSATRA